MRRSIQKWWQFFFGDSARAFGSLSVILLLCLAIAPAKDRFREWTRYQQRYLRLIRGRGEAGTLQRRFQGGLQQIWMPELGVTDRCGTCHLGLKEASLADVAMQPFRPHPQIPHSLTEFGCVMCHRGQGAATDVEEAHRSTLAWEQPILPARYLESSCGQCHWNTLTGTPQLNLGRKLLARYACVSCHVLKTPEGRRLEATTDAPSLEHIARKDHPGVDVRLAEESASLRGVRGHAEFSAHGRRCARYLRVPDGTKHAIPAGWRRGPA